MMDSVVIGHWFNPNKEAALFRVRPCGENSVNFPELRNRITLAIDLGAANVHLRPTIAEARDLIAALQWALQSAEPATAQAAA